MYFSGLPNLYITSSTYNGGKRAVSRCILAFDDCRSTRLTFFLFQSNDLVNNMKHFASEYAWEGVTITLSILHDAVKVIEIVEYEQSDPIASSSLAFLEDDENIFDDDNINSDDDSKSMLVDTSNETKIDAVDEEFAKFDFKALRSDCYKLLEVYFGTYSDLTPLVELFVIIIEPKIKGDLAIGVWNLFRTLSKTEVFYFLWF